MSNIFTREGYSFSPKSANQGHKPVEKRSDKKVERGGRYQHQPKHATRRPDDERYFETEFSDAPEARPDPKKSESSAPAEKPTPAAPAPEKPVTPPEPPKTPEKKPAPAAPARETPVTPTPEKPAKSAPSIFDRPRAAAPAPKPVTNPVRNRPIFSKRELENRNLAGKFYRVYDEYGQCLEMGDFAHPGILLCSSADMILEASRPAKLEKVLPFWFYDGDWRTREYMENHFRRSGIVLSLDDRDCYLLVVDDKNEPELNDDGGVLLASPDEEDYYRDRHPDEI